MDKAVDRILAGQLVLLRDFKRDERRFESLCVDEDNLARLGEAWDGNETHRLAVGSLNQGRVILRL